MLPRDAKGQDEYDKTICGKQKMAPVKPRIIVQRDWNECLFQNEGKSWVTYQRPGEPSVHGELTCQSIGGSGDPYVVGSNQFTINSVTARKLNVSYEDSTSQLSCCFQAPNANFSSIHKTNKSIYSIDVTSGGLAVSCCSEGKLRLWTSDNGEVRRDLQGHCGDVYTSQFFPSGLVVLSGGADMQLKIWSAETGKCAATFQGHRGGITSTAVIERGRNVISSSRDGCVKLWDCGRSNCLTTISVGGGLINDCSVGVPANTISLGSSQESPDEREVGSEGKLLLAACENKCLLGYGLQSRKKIFELACSDAVNCCTFVSDLLIVCGTQDGGVYLVDLRDTSTPLVELREGRSAVLSLLPHRSGAFISTGDGSCFYVTDNYTTSFELTGPDCDPIYSTATDGSHIYTACRDGTMRKYSLDLES